MAMNRIQDCRDARCPPDPDWLEGAISVCVCPVCERNVYHCNPEAWPGDWRRIEPDPDWQPPVKLAVGDIVQFNGHPVWKVLENFEATICEIQEQDQAAEVILHLIGRHVPFWISMKYLAFARKR